ncbi:ImmA/IrrE family metallo-endopeptidase [Phytoactinopolyspora limicola]|uniref:ImmA/IrrE family metallo-endopeptidase n=1 Tax=Phytoactinopolyspora limicola TaxID=2715536 RepID=UPI00140E4959|nr:ImmA/IrrE family metallo-endopeptidase [Phytoactinopolyspora limicola]
MPAYEEDARNAAEGFREENGLGIAPIADIVALIEQTQDVDVAVFGVDDSNEHGLTMIDPARGATIVAVASSTRPMRWRSTLAHELGHLIFKDHDNGKPGVLSAGSVVEKRAQSFARHVLIPLPGVQHFLERHNERLETRAFSDLVQRFQVSPAVAAIQLRALGAINAPQHTEWSAIYTPTLAARFGWADQYRSLQAESRHRRAPQQLLARVIEGYVAGLVSLETVASVRGIAPTDLAAEFDEAGIKPTARDDGADKDDLLAGADPGVDLSWLDDA